MSLPEATTIPPRDALAAETIPPRDARRVYVPPLVTVPFLCARCGQPRGEDLNWRPAHGWVCGACKADLDATPVRAWAVPAVLIAGALLVTLAALGGFGLLR